MLVLFPQVHSKQDSLMRLRTVLPDILCGCGGGCEAQALCVGPTSWVTLHPVLWLVFLAVASFLSRKASENSLTFTSMRNGVRMLQLQVVRCAPFRLTCSLARKQVRILPTPGNPRDCVTSGWFGEKRGCKLQTGFVLISGWSLRIFLGVPVGGHQRGTP